MQKVVGTVGFHLGDDAYMTDMTIMFPPFKENEVTAFPFSFVHFFCALVLFFSRARQVVTEMLEYIDHQSGAVEIIRAGGTVFIWFSQIMVAVIDNRVDKSCMWSQGRCFCNAHGIGG